MINSIYTLAVQNGVATSQPTASFNPVVIPYGAVATWVSDLFALRLAYGG